MADIDQVNTGVVVPTLGTRPAFLAQCVASIRRSSRCTLVVNRPGIGDCSGVPPVS